VILGYIVNTFNGHLGGLSSDGLKEYILAYVDRETEGTANIGDGRAEGTVNIGDGRAE